ncbi:probable carboxylesterase 18 [Rhodamnia argentea]|uniref:Probable carboxylesterase 18 n=1 Tax=Rhodamnia argentea TaxID=178133 RepID=A0A8B8QYI9_9MYRT|nr:probable carboxylesterase 18 [Rhodamnia argentea]
MATSAKSSSSSSSLDMPWKTRVAISILSRVTDYCRRPDGTINRRLLGFLDFKSPPNPTPVNGVSSSDVPVDPSRDLWFRLYTPAASTTSPSLPVLVFFHGGGFSFLSPASKAYDAVCRRFARKVPAVVVSVNYRLAPEHRFPSQYDDGFDVLRFLDDESSVLPPIADLSKCFLAGDSAGGNIAHYMAVRACQSEKKLQRVRVVGLVAIQPFFGGTERTESETRLEEAPLVSVRRTDWCWKALLPEGEDRDHWAANVSGPNAVDVAGLEGFPATLVVAAGFDPLRDWQKRYYEWLRRSGKEAELVDYPTMFHAFYIFPEVAQSTELIRKVKDFIQNLVTRE